jgi:hypothetical protein
MEYPIQFDNYEGYADTSQNIRDQLFLLQTHFVQNNNRVRFDEYKYLLGRYIDQFHIKDDRITELIVQLDQVFEDLYEDHSRNDVAYIQGVIQNANNTLQIVKTLFENMAEYIYAMMHDTNELINSGIVINSEQARHPQRRIMEELTYILTYLGRKKRELENRIEEYKDLIEDRDYELELAEMRFRGGLDDDA